MSSGFQPDLTVSLVYWPYSRRWCLCHEHNWAWSHDLSPGAVWLPGNRLPTIVVLTGIRGEERRNIVYIPRGRPGASTSSETGERKNGILILRKENWVNGVQVEKVLLCINCLAGTNNCFGVISDWEQVWRIKLMEKECGQLRMKRITNRLFLRCGSLEREHLLVKRCSPFAKTGFLFSKLCSFSPRCCSFFAKRCYRLVKRCSLLGKRASFCADDVLFCQTCVLFCSTCVLFFRKAVLFLTNNVFFLTNSVFFLGKGRIKCG